MSTDPGCGVPGEIETRLTALAEAAREGRTVVLPPLLILGTCERVGSNWVSDSLRPAAGQHNEPFRQQIGPDHPWSAVNPLLTGIGSTAPSAIAGALLAVLPAALARRLIAVNGAGRG